MGDAVLRDEPSEVVKAQEKLEGEFTSGVGDGEWDLKEGAGANGECETVKAQLVWDRLVLKGEGVRGQTRGGAEAAVAKLMLDGDPPAGACESAGLGGQEAEAAAGAKGDGRGVGVGWRQEDEEGEQAEEEADGELWRRASAKDEEGKEAKREDEGPGRRRVGIEGGASLRALGRAGAAADIAGLLG